MEYSASYVAIQESLFITIPSELVSAVFGYLAAKDLVVCSLVCRKWSQYSSYESVWKALCYVSNELAVFHHQITDLN